MSFFRGTDPEAGNAWQCEAIAHVVVPRTVDLGDHFLVRRGLPSARSRMVVIPMPDEGLASIPRPSS